MQRKNSLHRDTSSMRIARAAQVRLDEISDRIERDKHKRIKSNYHEKVKIWNELKSIHRVFEPLYVIKENQAKLARNQPDLSKLDSKTRAHESDGMRKDGTVSLKYQPRLLQGAETQSNVTKQRRRHTEPKIEALAGWKAKLVTRYSLLVALQVRIMQRVPRNLSGGRRVGLSKGRRKPRQNAHDWHYLREPRENTNSNYAALQRSLVFLTQCAQLHWDIWLSNAS